VIIFTFKTNICVNQTNILQPNGEDQQALNKILGQKTISTLK